MQSLTPARRRWSFTGIKPHTCTHTHVKTREGAVALFELWSPWEEVLYLKDLSVTRVLSDSRRCNLLNILQI